MPWQTLDDIIEKEVTTVLARRVILDQLEGGPKSGSELRDAIRKEIAAEEIRKSGKKPTAKRLAAAKDVKVTDPKLYFNTKHLESLRIIRSSRVSQQRVFAINPRAIQAVRRVLGLSRPQVLVTSMARPDEQRPFVGWFCRQKRMKPKIVRVFVEKQPSARGWSKDLERYITEDCKMTWETFWHDIPQENAGDYDGQIGGNLEESYDVIEEIILDDLVTHEVIVDVSRGPPLLTVSLYKLASDYSLATIFAGLYQKDRAELVHIFPQE